MDRKKSFQMKQRFDRCKTPMGSVPISVIMGFDYPLDSTTEIGGRGELNSRSSYKSNYSLPQTSHFNTNYIEDTKVKSIINIDVMAIWNGIIKSFIQSKNRSERSEQL